MIKCPSDWMLSEAEYMERALFHAERGRGRTSPNPLVGAVVVSPDGVIANVFAARVPSTTAESRAWYARRISS